MGKEKREIEREKGVRKSGEKEEKGKKSGRKQKGKTSRYISGEIFAKRNFHVDYLSRVRFFRIS